MPKIAIIVLVYNGREYLPDLLNSFKNQDYPQEFCEVILVDNASSDGSQGFIKTNFSEFTLIQNQKNEGFAKGNNIGIKYVLEKGFDYIVSLNQDTVVEKNWLKELVKIAEKDKKIGAVQPLILFSSERDKSKNEVFCFSERARKRHPQNWGLFWDKQNKINTSGNKIHFLGFGFCGDFGARVEDYKLEYQEIAYASGGAVLFKAKVLKEVG